VLPWLKTSCARGRAKTCSTAPVTRPPRRPGPPGGLRQSRSSPIRCCLGQSCGWCWESRLVVSLWPCCPSAMAFGRLPARREVSGSRCGARRLVSGTRSRNRFAYNNLAPRALILQLWHGLGAVNPEPLASALSRPAQQEPREFRRGQAAYCRTRSGRSVTALPPMAARAADAGRWGSGE
jgi:hypothetical protein